MLLNKQNVLQSDAGFTLVEVIIAMLVLGVGLVGLLGMSSQAMNLSNNNSEWTNARMLAQSVLESRTAEDFDKLQAEAAAAPYTSEDFVYDTQAYEIRMWHTPKGGSRDPIQITVQVIPPAADPVSLTTIKTFYL